MSNYITSIHVNQIFHLKDLDIPVSTDKKQHLLLTGKNGSGKTSLMNAMMEFIEKIYADKPLQFLDYDKTLKSFNEALEQYKQQGDAGNVAKHESYIRSWEQMKKALYGKVDVKFKDITKLEPFNRNLPDSTRFYAVEAEACFSVDGTDVYRFSSDCDRVWIDGRLVIDNSEEEAKRFSRHDVELALSEGGHSVRVLYIFNIRGGWNPLRNKTEVMIRRKGNSQYITTN